MSAARIIALFLLAAVAVGAGTLHFLDLRVGQPMALRAMAAEPVGRTFREIGNDSLRTYTVTQPYVPEPAQGTRHVTWHGPLPIVWWGWGPPGNAPRPAIILLHGAGRTGESMVDMWRETAEAESLVLVAPDLGKIPGFDRLDPNAGALMAALRAAAMTYPVDMDRVAVFGHSNGAVAAQALVNRYEGPWRAAAVHAGIFAGPTMRKVADGVPIRHYLDSLDQIFPLGIARRAGQAMAAAGHPFELVRIDGHNHWFYDGGEAIAAHAWDWLAGQLG